MPDDSITGQQHFDLLISVLACGAQMKDFKLHGVIGMDNLKKMHISKQLNWTQRHSKYVTLMTPAGESVVIMIMT